MARAQGKDRIYEVAQRFIDATLKNNDSLFTPGKEVWSTTVIDDLYERFIEKPDESSDSFEVKFKRQLEGAPAATFQLAAEMVYFHLMPSVSTTGDTKRRLVDEILSWMPDPAVKIPSDSAGLLDDGIWSTGVAFHTHRPHQLWFLLSFVMDWKQLEGARQSELLSDPWVFKEWLENVPISKAYIQRNAILHLVHPDAFEHIVSRGMKERIALRFADLVSQPTKDVDRQLLAIRRKLAEEHGPHFTFSDPGIMEMWQPDSSKWGQFVYWTRRFYERDFDNQERNYKLEIAENLRLMQHAVQSGAKDWIPAAKTAFGKPNNLTPWQMHDSFLTWCAASPDEARDALLTLWEPTQTFERRVRGFLEKLSPSVKAGRDLHMTLASFLHLAIEPTEYPIFRRTPFVKAYELTDTAGVDSSWDELQVYGHAMKFLDTFAEEASARGLELRDRLDAQGLVWAVLKNKGKFLSPKEQKELNRWRDKATGIIDVTADPIQELANQLLLDANCLQEIVSLLETKGQIIFHGPPGTGKTFVARELAKILTAGGGAYRVVQFHPSYAYEDFVEGYRPTLYEGQPGFARKDGPLKDMAQRASSDPNQTYILIMDEINRGNLAKLLGELYFLLEYRNEQVRLQYSDTPFALPSNLWFIGTMNTADRSIALVDSALRRRFYFVPFFPDEVPIEGLLRRWLKKHKAEYEWVADVVERANVLLGDRHAAIGPSYFLRKDLDDAWIERIWTHSVMPYLQEHFFGDESRLEEFALGALRKEPSVVIDAPEAEGG